MSEGVRGATRGTKGGSGDGLSLDKGTVRRLWVPGYHCIQNDGTIATQLLRKNRPTTWQITTGGKQGGRGWAQKSTEVDSRSSKVLQNLTY